MKLRACCIKCHAHGPWRFTPEHRLVRMSRQITPKEVEELAVGHESLDSWEARNGDVSESGKSLRERRRRVQVLIICEGCGRTWWTIQRGIVAGWFAHFEMGVPMEMEDLYRAAA